MMTLELILRILVAGLLGGLIGIEREYRAKEAGFRTHFLVALGSALFMVISQYGFDALLATHHVARLDPSRVAAQVVTGIGFIGAGTIIFQKQVVRGLTTAAGLWVTSAIGLACGSGAYIIATASAFLVLLCLEVLHHVLARFGSRNVSLRFSTKEPGAVDTVLERLQTWNVELENYELTEVAGTHGSVFRAELELRVPRTMAGPNLFSFMNRFPDVRIEYLG